MAKTRSVKDKPGMRKRNVLTTRSQQRKAVRQSYPKEALEAALAEARQPNHQPLNAIAKSHGVPSSTMHRHLTGTTSCTHIGRQPYLSKEVEDQIVDKILLWLDRGFALQKSQLAAFVFHIAKKLQPDSRMIKSWERTGTSAKWTRGFLKRHPIISERLAQIKGRETGPDEYKHYVELLAQVQAAFTE
ncbi:g11845 [Coccomyxa elongata]